MARHLQTLAAIANRQMKYANAHTTTGSPTKPEAKVLKTSAPTPSNPATGPVATPSSNTPPKEPGSWYTDPVNIGLASLLGAGGLTALLEYRNREKEKLRDKANIDEQIAKEVYG